ncbi:GntR family transcriptional regulator [Brevibacterium marinum]|uniref:DNA-binding GntR family transcriptional regulator n=1 Tax=Brevibacterium marinum TaxID=418643 RepID=A0A846S387_9MICO|nr:GntR family transcriptional regulator [Brevibacterium marinum]NJC55327.1 DNA-binding GntR family transcriptional regulator [Brevibacterium marinum]
MNAQPSIPRADITRRGLRDLVYEHILEILLTGEISPGERVSIDGLARQLNVSPTPVREALVDLERTGLVVREARRGYRVSPPLDRGQLQELFIARETVETAATRLATPADDDLLRSLEAAHAEHTSAGEKVRETAEHLDETAEDPDETRRNQVSTAQEYFARDRDFHDRILEHCGNRYLVKMSNDLGAQVHRLRQALPHGITDVNEALAEHRAIIEAFASPDPTAPEAAMRHHVRMVAHRALVEDPQPPGQITHEDP